MKFWCKKLARISPFKDISWNQKFKKIKILPMVFLSWEIGRNYTVVLSLLSPYIWRKYSFWDDFLIHENFKKAEIWNIFWCNKWNRKLNISHIFQCRQDDRMLTFGLSSCIFLKFLKIFEGCHKKFSQKSIFHHPLLHKIVWEI